MELALIININRNVHKNRNYSMYIFIPNSNIFIHDDSCKNLDALRIDVVCKM